MIYKGIYDLPTFNWWELNETNDLKYLLLDPKQEITNKLKVKLNQRYSIIKDQFFDDIALDFEVESFILKNIKLAEYRCDIIMDIDRDRNMTAFLFLEREIKAMQQEVATSGKKFDNLKSKAVLEKSQGYYIDTRVMPIAEYHSIIDNFKEEQSAIRAENERRKRAK